MRLKMSKKIIIAIFVIATAFTSIHAEDNAGLQYLKGSGNGLLNAVFACAGVEYARSTSYVTQDWYHQGGVGLAICGTFWGFIFEGTWRTLAYFVVGCIDVPTGGGFGKMFYGDFFPEDFSTRWKPIVVLD